MLVRPTAFGPHPGPACRSHSLRWEKILKNMSGFPGSQSGWVGVRGQPTAAQVPRKESTQNANGRTESTRRPVSRAGSTRRGPLMGFGAWRKGQLSKAPSRGQGAGASGCGERPLFMRLPAPLLAMRAGRDTGKKTRPQGHHLVGTQGHVDLQGQRGACASTTGP